MFNKIFDSHCHLQMAQYDQDREEIIQRSLNAGVNMICVGTDLETSRQAIELAQKHEGIWASVGLHPNDVDELRIMNYELSDFEKLISEPKAVAVGEIGLDYYRTPEREKQEKQKEVFEKFLDLAIQYNKPVIIHSRDAAKGTTGRVHQDLLNILNTKYLIHNTRLRGVAHSFTGSTEDAKRYVDMGFYLGFNGIITFANQYDAIVREVPVDKILLETDAPYLTPEPYRGQRNESAYVKEVAKKIAQIKGISTEEVIIVTTQNTLNLFKISI